MPLLAIVAFMAPNHVVESTAVRLENIGIGLLAIAGLIAAGHWLLNPLFRILAAAKAREVMTAAALLVVLCGIAHASERFDYGNGRFLGWCVAI